MSKDNINPRLFLDDEFEEINLIPEKVVCLGMEFKSEDARRKYFREELQKKLPELKHIEGFPIGEDDDIINLSDPPYYTACPNPWINDFIDHWEKEKINLEKGGKRSERFEVKKPYASDINEGKNHPIYNAHSYHTKVPHYVIMNYYLHYTQPGDIVLDNFSGTGMAGVAANNCNNPDSATLNYFNTKWKEEHGILPLWGKRNCILSDLSPLCSYITYNYNNSISADIFKKYAQIIYGKLEEELGYLYKMEIDKYPSEIIYTIWSENQICPHCAKEFVLWDTAIDFNNKIQKNDYQCPFCSAIISKRNSIKAQHLVYDVNLQKNISKVIYTPVVVNGIRNNARFEKELSQEERLFLINQEKNLSFTTSIAKELPIGGETQRNIKYGITHSHHFFTKRNLIILERMKSLIDELNCDYRIKAYLRIWFTSCQSRLHLMNRYAVKHHRHVGPMANTLYVSSTPTEISPFYFIKSKIKDNYLQIISDKNIINQVCSATNSSINDNSIDYIFTDPPFGANIAYSELNFLWESWLNVFTNNENEAICNNSQNKGLFEYQSLMLNCFKEYYRILKPGKWITIEFSNTSSAVWNCIQNSLQNAGFVIASVSDLNKGRGGLHGIVGVVAVCQDLAITCYKPSSELSDKFERNIDKSLNAMDFIEELLSHLPVHLLKDNSTTTIIERNPKILYDRLISYYVQHGYQIPMDAHIFQKELRDRFIERDGMFFTASQAIEYENEKSKTVGVVQMSLFIGSESDGIEWLKNQLDNPKTYQELQPEWMKNMTATKKGDVLPELYEILEENFIKGDDGAWRKPDPEKAADLEIIRGRKMMKEYSMYLEQAQKPKAKRMKDTRLEVLRYGFRECYKQKDYKSIILVGDHIQETLLQEDEILLQYYDIASTRL